MPSAKSPPFFPSRYKIEDFFKRKWRPRKLKIILDEKEKKSNKGTYKNKNEKDEN